MKKSPTASTSPVASSKLRKVSLFGAVLAALALGQSGLCRSTRSQAHRVQHAINPRIEPSTPLPSSLSASVVIQEDRPDSHDGSNERTISTFNDLSDNERSTATAIVQQVLQEQRAAMLSAATAADIRDIVMDGLSRAVESDEDHPPSHLDTCARVDRSYLSSGSQRRLIAATQAACVEMGPLVQEQIQANHTPRAVLLAEALQEDCGVRSELPDPVQLAIDQGRFDLVTATLEARMNTMHEQWSCYPAELADAGNVPRLHIISEVLKPFISRHPGYLSSLTWTWTPDLLECADFALLTVSVSYIPGIDRNVPREALRRDSIFIQSRLPRRTFGDGSVVTP